MTRAPFSRILLPVDESALATRVTRPLQRLCQPGLTEVTLLRVDAPLGAADDARAQLHLAAQVAAVRERLGDETRVHAVIARGDPAEEITRYARETRQELVAMATHGRSGVARWVRGSVAERVLRTCDAPLLLCNPHALDADQEHRFRQILVPLDGSSAAESVLPAVEKVAAAHDALVTLLIIEPLVMTELPSPLLAGSLWDPTALELSLKPVVDRLERAGLRVDATSAYGVVADEILRAAKSTDLLAMATHGRSGPSRWWFGSVAEQVLREATCPLLVARTVWP